MVKKSARILLLLCMTSSSWAAAETRLTAKTDKTSSVLGEPVQLEIRAEDVREPLSSISLEKLKADFNVYGISGSAKTERKNNRSLNTETMLLTLYPLRSGKLMVPAFSYRGSSSKPLALAVTESGKKTSKVFFKTALDTEQPLVRQAVTLSLEIYDDGTLQWTAPQELNAVGAHQRRLSESQREETLEGTRYTVHRYAWALMPLREGKITVEFPMLDAFRFGTHLRYPVAPFMINAAPVPAYLQVHVPIGQPQISVEPLPLETALEKPVNWMLTIQGTGISEEGVGKLLGSINSNADLHFYPPSIGKGGNERVSTALQTLQVTIPFVPVRTGNVQLPALNIPYFDPSSMQVGSVYLEGAQVQVFNPAWRTAQKVALVLLALSSMAGLGYWLYKKLRSYLHRNKVLLEISRAANADMLHEALLKFTGEARPMQNLTLQQWLQHTRQFYRTDERLGKMVRNLEAAKYADENAKVDITELAHEAAGLIKLCGTRSTHLAVKIQPTEL